LVFTTIITTATTTTTECGTCQCPLTLKHILIECVDLNDVRNKYFVFSSMKDLFENDASQNIVDFIKETH